MTSLVNGKADTATGRNWDRLMAAAQEGDADSYRILLSEVAVCLRGYYARLLPPGVANDAVHDALLAIHAKRHTYDPGHPFGPWLAAIARHKAIGRLRSLISQSAQPLDETTRIADRDVRRLSRSACPQARTHIASEG